MPDPTTPASVPSPERGFWRLVALQFQGAFSDNAFKIILMSYVIMMYGGESDQHAAYNARIAALFPVAYLIFSCWAGFLADKFSKRNLTLLVKVSEIGIMTIGLVVVAGSAGAGGPSQGMLLGLIGVLFLMYVQSAFFSPNKYGIIPELVPEQRLAWANGVVAMTTYLAIILGMALTNEVFDLLRPDSTAGRPDRLYILMIVLVALAVAGLAAGWGIPVTPRAQPRRDVPLYFFPELKRYFSIIARDRALARTVLGLAFFWGLGLLLLTHANVWGKASLGMSDVGANRLYWVLAAGIGAGSALTGWISRQRIEPGLVPLGSLVMALFAFPLAFGGPENRLLMIGALFLLGVGAGLFSVPLNAILQQRADPRDRGGIIAATNYATNVAMLLSVAIYKGLNAIEVTPNGIYLFVSLVTLIGTIVVLILTPEALVRFIGFAFARTFYRIRVLGLENVPSKGPALLVSNHVSFIDAILLMAVSPRPIRFVAFEGFFEQRLMGFFLRSTRSIPISSRQGPRELINSLRTAGEALRDGDVVCIFAEGQITRTGMLLPFRRGYERILKDNPAPVVPVYLDGVWGSIFSFQAGKFFWKRPRQIPYPLRIAFGPPREPGVSAFDLRQAIQELSAETAIAAKGDLPLIHRRMIHNCRRHWRQFAMTDSLTPPINMGRALWGSIILARRLRKAWADQERVGVMLPPTVGAALVNYAAALTGRTVVNLNYSIGQEVLDGCAARTGLRTVVTSRKFLEMVKLESPAEAVYIEDLRTPKPGALEVAGAVLAARLLPARAIEHYCGALRHAGPDDLATIIFSSGSTGLPKGVMLSHFNITANIDSFLQAIGFWPSDRLLGVLPFFHSFGYTVSLWAPICAPFGSVFHVNPLDTRAIGQLCEEHKVTLMVTTPTFMQFYQRRMDPGQFGGLNLVMTGAERLPDAVRQAFLKKFGIEPLQGYGATECAPVVTANTDDYRSPGFHQTGHKRGSIGKPLPGVAVRVSHPETGERLGPGESGLLWVRGANVMQGYLDQPEKTAEALRDGWYNTGDIGAIGEDGFITITGRLSRFSKIGGEMVPHGTVEDKMHEVLGIRDEKRLVVTATTDQTKGERLVVLHTLDDTQIDGLGEKLAAADLPNLFIPRRDAYFRIDALPMLGSGKLDLKECERLAKALTTTPKEKVSES